MNTSNNTPVKPDTGLVWGILTTLFCCLPFGIVSIVKATQVDTYWAMGNYDEAYAAASSARKWALISLACSILIPIMLILFYAALVALGLYVADGTLSSLDHLIQ